MAVGTICDRKDYATLVRALKTLVDLEWSLACFGSLTREPTTAKAIVEQVETLGLAQRVRFEGEVGEAALASGYETSHLFVMSSRYEGYGMALTEALARGLPIVATDAGPTAHILPKSAGIVVPAGDPVSLGSTLRRVMTDPALYCRLADGARHEATGLAGWDSTVSRFVAELARVAA